MKRRRKVLCLLLLLFSASGAFYVFVLYYGYEGTMTIYTVSAFAIVFCVQF
jgi:hypothetical protein